MLPAAARMRARTEFTATVRGGVRAASPTVTVHASPPPAAGTASAAAMAPHVGFIVTRSVGNAVLRNRVRRRLRHLMRERLHVLPAGSSVVVRVHPAAAGVRAAVLAGDLDRALLRARDRMATR